MTMQLFLEIFFQVSIFVAAILLPLSLALFVVGNAIKNVGILRSAFYSAIGAVVVYVAYFATQMGVVFYMAEEAVSFVNLFADINFRTFLFSVIISVIVGSVIAFISYRRFKKIA